MADVTEWSNSSLSCLERCGEQFRRRVLEKERVRPTFRMSKGTVIHAATAASMTRKMNQGELPSLEEMRDLTATEFERVWSTEQPEADTEDIEEAGSERALIADAKDFAVDLSGLHLQRVAPAINPVAVERTIVVKPQDSDISIRGTLDLVDAQSDGEVVRDTKSSTKSPSRTTAETSQQLDMYGLIRVAETGVLPKGYQLDYLVRTPAKKDLKHVPLATTRTAEDLGTVVHRINVAVDAVKKGVFMPTAPDSWWCSKSWCEFHSPTDPNVKPCVYVKRGNRPQN